MAKRRIPFWMKAGIILGTAWASYKYLTTDHNMPIGPAIDAPRDEFHGRNSSLLSYYAKTDATGRPLVLLHSVNVAASAYEVKPIFQHYRGKRPVYALDLPGFGFSGRTNREYSVELYVSAIQDFLTDIVTEPADVVALSLSSEFASIVAQQSQELFHSLTCISPTGFSHRKTQADDPDSLYRLLSNPLWNQVAYDLLVSKSSLRAFLAMNSGGNIEPGLLDYAYRTSHQPGARYAPIRFVSGSLFSPKILDTVYKSLQIPVMVIYDSDPNTGFDRLPDVLASNSNWRARRILNTRGMPHFDRPDMTMDALDNFYEDLDAS